MDAAMEIFYAGGHVMYVLLICSIITWAVLLERLWVQRGCGRVSGDFIDKIKSLIVTKNIGAALESCRASSLPIAKTVESLLVHFSNKTLGKDAMNNFYKRAKLDMSRRNRQYLWLLGTIGSAAPFLGLFGTVVGILRAFGKIAETGNTGFVVVAAGISEALIATAAGIMVAVIAVVFYNYLQVRATSITTEGNLLMESVGDILLGETQQTKEENRS